jgi:hypothetical protein
VLLSIGDRPTVRSRSLAVVGRAADLGISRAADDNGGGAL